MLQDLVGWYVGLCRVLGCETVVWELSQVLFSLCQLSAKHVWLTWELTDQIELL